jgi:hypothetical protein
MHVFVGWGWGQDTFAGRTVVANNSIDGVLSYSADGGNIYSQSPQHNSSIYGNYGANDGNRYGMIYTDVRPVVSASSLCHMQLTHSLRLGCAMHCRVRHRSSCTTMCSTTGMLRVSSFMGAVMIRLVSTGTTTRTARIYVAAPSRRE